MSLTGMSGTFHNLKAKSAGRFQGKPVFVERYRYFLPSARILSADN